LTVVALSPVCIRILASAHCRAAMQERIYEQVSERGRVQRRSIAPESDTVGT